MDPHWLARCMAMWGRHHSRPSKNPNQCRPLQSCNFKSVHPIIHLLSNDLSSDRFCWFFANIASRFPEKPGISPAGAGCPSNKVGSDLELHEEEFIGLRDYTEKKKQFWCTLLLPKLTKTLARKVKWPNTWLRSAAFFISQPLMLILGKHVCSNTMINFWNLMLRRAYKQDKVQKSKQGLWSGSA